MYASSIECDLCMIYWNRCSVPVVLQCEEQTEPIST